MAAATYNGATPDRAASHGGAPLAATRRRPLPAETLYRKWRPQTFVDLVGQDVVAQTLEHAVRDGRLVHAYLFTGPRGTGKTSTARILARAMNCTGRAPQSGEPCGTCEACVSIAAGTAMDVIEVDAASNRRLDEMRELLDKVVYRPSSLRRKVYILDEAHALTPDASNAFLKTLEEPPDHVVFILCTTEAQSLSATVTSRCQRFDFARISVEAMAARLAQISLAEGIDADADAVAVIAQLAQGALRDAVGLLDQAIASASGGRLDIELVNDLFGLAPAALMERLVQAVCEGSAAEALEALDGVWEASADPRQVARTLAQRLRQRLRQALAAGGAGAGGRSGAWLRLAQRLAGMEAEIRRGGDGRLLLELALAEMALLAPASSGADDRAPAPTRSSEVPKLRESAPPAAPPPPPAARPPAQPAPALPPRPPAPAAPPPAAAPSSVDPAADRPAPAQADPAPPAAELEVIIAAWPRVLEAVRQRDRPTGAFLHEGSPTIIDGDTLVVGFAGINGFHRDSADRAASRAFIEPALAQVLGRAWQVRMVLLPDGVVPSPREVVAPSPQGRGEVSSSRDLVQEAVNIFGGRVRPAGGVEED